MNLQRSSPHNEIPNATDSLLHQIKHNIANHHKYRYVYDIASIYGRLSPTFSPDLMEFKIYIKSLIVGSQS